MLASVLETAARRMSVRASRSEKDATAAKDVKEKRESTRSAKTASTAGFSMRSVPATPLGVLMAGGRSVRMEGVLKMRVDRRKGRTPFAWKARFVVLEEGRLRISRSEEDDDGYLSTFSRSSTASSASGSAGPVSDNKVALAALVDVRYARRGMRDFGLVGPQNQQLRFRAKNGEEAEVWLQHILQEMRNQAQLNLKCAELMLKQGQTRNIEVVLRQALFMMELSMGPAHKGVAEALEALANFVASQGDEDAAAEYQERADDIRGNPAHTRATMKHFSGENAGLQELRMWLELKNRAEDGADAMERAVEMQRREAELINIMSDQHATKVQELQNKAVAAERRARAAEKELAMLRVAKRERTSLADHAEPPAAPVPAEEAKSNLRKSVGRLMGRLSITRKRSLSRSMTRQQGPGLADDALRADPASREDRARPDVEAEAEADLELAAAADDDIDAFDADTEASEEEDADPDVFEDDGEDDEMTREMAKSFQGQDLGTLEAMEQELLEVKRESEEARQASELELRERMRALKAKKAARRRDQGMQMTLQRSLDRRDEDGACYLCYAKSSAGGTLFAKWSREPVEDAIGRFYVGEGVRVPKFKFAHNHGRQELARGFSSSGGFKRYYEGVIAFLKLAFDHRSVQVALSGGLLPMRVYLWRDEFVFNISKAAVFSVLGVEGIAIVNEASELFSGIVKLPLEQFCVMGAQNGHSILLRRARQVSQRSALSRSSSASSTSGSLRRPTARDESSCDEADAEEGSSE